MKLTADEPVANEQFGFAVTTDGTTIVVGTNDQADPSYGSVYALDTETGQQLYRVTAPEPVGWEFFGRKVSVSGNNLLIGSRGTGNGAAYIYDLATGGFIKELVRDDPTSIFDAFSTSVALSGTTALVGAYTHDAIAPDAGAVYVFDTVTGDQIFKLTANDAGAGDRFGFSIAVSGNIAVIGAYQDGETSDGVYTGSAYIFDISTGQQLHKLTASDATAGDEFGWSVAVDGNIAVVGAHKDNHAGEFSGSAYLFDVTTGTQIQKLTVSDAKPQQEVGYSVAIDGTLVAVGAPRSREAYIFDAETGNETYKLVASDTADTGASSFGHAVGLVGNTAIVGAPEANNVLFRPGAAYVFDVTPYPLGDLDRDGFVGIADLNLILSNWNQFVPPGDPRADAGGVGGSGPDGYIGIDDLNVVLGNWNAGTPPVSAVVPEPGSVAMLGMALVTLYGARRNRRSAA